MSLRLQTAGGIAWSLVGQGGRQALHFGISVLLTRLLTPSAFGLVGMVLVFSGVARLFADLGFSGALIQRKDLEDRHLSSAFWLNLAAGVLLTALMAASAPLVASIYGEPALVPLTIGMAFNFVLASAGVVHKAVLWREIDFKAVAKIELASTVVAGVAAVAAALSGAGVWSLVILTLATTGLENLLVWLVGSWRPQRRFDTSAVREMWGFSSNLLGFQTVNYLTRNADNFLIGRALGAAPLGLYTRAYSIMLLPLNQVTRVVTRVMFPVLARMQDDLPRTKDVYLRAVGVIALLTFPAMAGLFVVAEPFVLTLFGRRWAEVVPILQILCLPGLLEAVGATPGWIYQSQGRTDWMFRWGMFSSVVSIVAFLVGVQWGVEGVAIAYAARSVLLTSLGFVVAGRLIDMSLGDVLRAVVGPLTVAVGTGAGVALVGSLLPASWPAVTILAVDVAVGVVACAALVIVFRLRAWRDARDLLRDLKSGRRPRNPADAAVAGVE